MNTVKAILRGLKALINSVLTIVSRLAGGSLMFALVVLALIVIIGVWAFFPIFKPLITSK